MKDIKLCDGNVLSVPDGLYSFVSEYIQKINEIEWIRESYAWVNSDVRGLNDYAVVIVSVVEDCSGKWIERITDRIGMEDSGVLGYVTTRSKFNSENKRDSLVKVQDSTWHGYIGDIARTRMATLKLQGGRKLQVSELKFRKLQWYVSLVLRMYPKLQKAYLFGSALHNWCTAGSDINLLLVVDDIESTLDVSMDMFTRFLDTRNDCILVCTESEFTGKDSTYQTAIMKECEVIYNRDWDSNLSRKKEG